MIQEFYRFLKDIRNHCFWSQNRIRIHSVKTMETRFESSSELEYPQEPSVNDFAMRNSFDSSPEPEYPQAVEYEPVNAL